MQRDPVQALGLATLLLCFCQADADSALLGRQEVAAAAVQLLKASLLLAAATGRRRRWWRWWWWWLDAWAARTGSICCCHISSYL